MVGGNVERHDDDIIIIQYSVSAHFTGVVVVVVVVVHLYTYVMDGHGGSAAEEREQEQEQEQDQGMRKTLYAGRWSKDHNVAAGKSLLTADKRVRHA